MHTKPEGQLGSAALDSSSSHTPQTQCTAESVGLTRLLWATHNKTPGGQPLSCDLRFPHLQRAYNNICLPPPRPEESSDTQPGQRTMRYVTPFQTSYLECLSLPQELLSTFQRPFSVHGGWEHFGKEKTDRALNDLHQQKFKNSPSADFLFIPITAQEERR